MPAVDPIHLTTSLINRLNKGEDKGSATGFFFITNKKLYLVTNKHVIYGGGYYKNPKPEIDQIKLNLHINPKKLSQNEEIIIDLFKGKSKKWLEHKDKEVDVVLVPINIDNKKYIIAPVDKSVIDSSNIQVGFEKIFVIGYPFGWYDKINNLPITRIGHLSSPFKVPFQGKPIMLGDVETHEGMSGGPVFMRIDDYVTIDGNKRTKHMGSYKIILVGIHSGQPRWDLIDRKTGKLTKTIGHSLINIWFSDLILEILKK
jgi:S1-C subfamily serine protease